MRSGSKMGAIMSPYLFKRASPSPNILAKKQYEKEKVCLRRHPRD